MLLPSTITARRTPRYTSTLYIHCTIHRLSFQPMNGGRRYSIQSPIVSNSSAHVAHFNSAFYTLGIVAVKAGYGCIGMTCCPGATRLDLRLASFFLRSIRCRSAQSSHLVWPGIEGEVQPTQSPAAFALSRLSCAWRRWYSLRSGRWARFRSYSRRSCFGASGSLGLGVVGFLVALLGLTGRDFFPVLFFAFGPRRVFLGSAKVCSSIILLEYGAGGNSALSVSK